MIDPVELELIKAKTTELKNFVSSSNDIFTQAQFSEFIVLARARIASGDHPTEIGRKIVGDQAHYEQAVDAIESELTPHFIEAERIYGVWSISDPDRLATKAAAVAKILSGVSPTHPQYDEKSFIASIVARRYDAEFLEDEQEEDRDEKKWFFKLWPNYYKVYAQESKKAGFDEATFFSEKTAELQTSGWTGLDEALLKTLFTTTAGVAALIIQAETDLDADGLTLSNLDQIEASLTTLHDISQPTETGIAETQVLYNRLLMRYQELRRQWMSRVDSSFIQRAREVHLLEPQLVTYGTYLASLDELKDNLELLLSGADRVSSPASILPEQREELKRLYEAVLENSKQSRTILKKIGPEDRIRLEELHARLINEARVLLGEETGESKTIFTDDVEWWMFANHGEQWRKTQRLWKQYQADNVDALIVYDKLTITNLIKYFSEEIQDLDEDDVAYNQRFIALDIQLNRLQEMHRAMERVETTPVDKTAPLSEHELPAWFKVPENTTTAWQQAYGEAAKEHGSDILFSQAKYLTHLSEHRQLQDKSWEDTFDEIKQYEGLTHAMENYHGEDEDRVHELAIFLKMREILFEAQAKPNHGVSLTCNMDLLPPWESNGVNNALFDYFTLGDDEVMGSSENKYKYSHQVKKLVQNLVTILYENPEPGFKSRDEGGSVFNPDGTPQKGWFGYYYWKDTPDNKDELIERMKYELRNGIAPGLSDEDTAEIAFFAHRVASLCGIRLDCFAPYMASGATPVDMLGDNSRYIGEVNLFAPELYSTYKKRVYLQLAEMIEIPEKWWAGLKKHKKAGAKRMNAVMRSFKASKLLCATMSEPREPYTIPISAADGVSIKNTYYSMFDFYFNDEVRKRRREKKVTLLSWQRGKTEFIEFKKICFDTPGGVDVNNLDSISEEDLIEKLVGHVDTLINRGLSYMKKNFDMAQWREMAIMTRWGIDRCFRVFALKNSNVFGSMKFLRQVRARLDQANTIDGAGKKYPKEIGAIEPSIQGINMDFDGRLLSPLPPFSVEKINELKDLNTNPEFADEEGRPPFTNEQVDKLKITGASSFPFSEKQSNLLKRLGVELISCSISQAQIKKLENEGTILSPIAKKTGIVRVVDAKEFLLESYPNWTIFNFKDAYKEGRLDLTQIKLQKPQRDELTMSIINPDIDELKSWVVRPSTKLQYRLLTNDLLTQDEYKLFKLTAKTGIFGIKPEKQQQDPDKEDSK